jgi:hypothetical protein
VKFRLTDVDGVAVQAVLSATFSQRRVGSACDNMTDVETSAPTEPQSGEYRIYASLNDGTVQTVDICLAK